MTQINLGDEVMEKARTENGDFRGLRVSIYKDNRLGNCSLHGISETHDRVFIICPEGNVLASDAKAEGTPIVRMVHRPFLDYKHIEPCDEKGKLRSGAMYGGCIIDCPDSRVRKHINKYPLRLHDRYEW